MIVDLQALDRLLDEEIVGRLDGKHINEEIPEFAPGKAIPTGEAMAIYLWQRLAPRLPGGVRLHSVQVQEDPHLYSEYLGGA